MKKKQIKQNNSGIRVCDSIVMSVKNKTSNLQLLESIIIAIAGYVSTIMIFLTMFEFKFNKSPVIISAVIFSAVYILLSSFKKNGIWFISGSIVVAGIVFWKKIGLISIGYKFVYNTIYKASYLTKLNYYKFLDSSTETETVTTFLILGVWLLAVIIYVFTIYHPHPLPPLIASFLILEIGLYNGINVNIFWGMMVIAFLLASFAMSTINMSEYSGGTGGFVRKGNQFIPKRHMRLKVTEKCGFYLLVLVMIVTGCIAGGLKLTNYERSPEINAKRTEIKDAVNNFSAENLAESITDLSAALGFEIKVESHKLGTVSVMKYKNTDDLKVTIKNPTDSAVYLKEYTCAVYGDNEWSSFPDSVYNSPLFDEVTQLNTFPQDFPHRFNLTLDRYQENNSMKIQNLIKGNHSYSPYGTDNIGGLSYDRDLTVSSKKRGQKSYNYIFTNTDAEVISMYLGSSVRSVLNLDMIADEESRNSTIEYCRKKGIIEYDSFINIDSPLHLPEQMMLDNPQLISTQILESEYRDFVYENYLNVPDNVNINEVRDEFAYILDNADTEFNPTTRMRTLYDIREAIAEKAEYSLAPGKTPKNRDFVNYFLMENNKGYCTHYATAGILLARMAGIPARYSAGYVLVMDDFNSSTLNDDGTYTINVKDNRRHAWAEIYLDGYGWVPFEFTEGYTQHTIDTTPVTTTTTTMTTTTTTTTALSETTETTTDSEVFATNSSSKNTLNNSKTTSTTATTGAGKAPYKTQRQDKEIQMFISILKQIFYLIVAVAFILLIFILRRKIIIYALNKKLNASNPIKQIKNIYAYAEQLLNYKEICTNEMKYTELSEFMEKSYSDVYFKSDEFAEFMDAALAAAFYNKPPAKKDNEKYLSIVRNIANVTYTREKNINKLIMKYIKCLL